MSDFPPIDPDELDGPNPQRNRPNDRRQQSFPPEQQGSDYEQPRQGGQNPPQQNPNRGGYQNEPTIQQGQGGYPPNQPPQQREQRPGDFRINDLGDANPSPRGSSRPSRQDQYQDDDFDRIGVDELGGGPARPNEVGRGNRRRIEEDFVERNDAPPERRPRPRSRGPLISERQVEALGWGLTVILLGVAILFAFTTGTQFLTIGFPIAGSILLLGTSVYQRLNGWDVSFITWLTAITLSAFSITRLIGIVDGEGTSFGDSIAYFIGTFIIITGTIVLIRIFQQPAR